MVAADEVWHVSTSVSKGCVPARYCRTLAMALKMIGSSRSGAAPFMPLISARGSAGLWLEGPGCREGGRKAACKKGSREHKRRSSTDGEAKTLALRPAAAAYLRIVALSLLYQCAPSTTAVILGVSSESHLLNPDPSLASTFPLGEVKWLPDQEGIQVRYLLRGIFWPKGASCSHW